MRNSVRNRSIVGWEILHRFAVQNDKSVSMCHSEERSDEESPAFLFLRTAREGGPYGAIRFVLRRFSGDS